MSESLSDKLKSLGVQVGAQNLPKPDPQGEDYPIEQVLDGMELNTPSGSVFQVKNTYPLDYIHGDVALSSAINPEFIGTWARAAALKDSALDKILFLDTETTGLAGGTGTFAFLIGLGFRSSGGFTVCQLFLRDPALEKALLEALNSIVSQFDQVVTFNGKSFDIPLLNTRHVLNSFQTPFPIMEHIDLLPLARRLWRNRLSSRALKDLEVEILHVPRTQEEVPSWMIPEIYFDYLRTRDARPMAGVFYHNAMDILSLAALFNFCSELLYRPLELQDVPGLDLAAVARLYEEMEQFEFAVSVYEESLKKGDLPLQFYIDTIQRFADMYRRHQRWEDAVSLWKRAAEYQWIDAFVELAKYYEHQAKDYPSAIAWTEAAMQSVENLAIPAWRKKALLGDLSHRQARLKKRISIKGGNENGS